MNNKITVRDATERWVSSMNAYPLRMIEILYKHNPEDWEEVTESDEEEYEYYNDVFPAWGWMWSFDDSADDYWLEELDGIRIMSDLGFRVYKSEEFGYFFGIDGAGYNFYEAHWIPLYKARGLQWHDVEEETP